MVCYINHLNTQQELSNNAIDVLKPMILQAIFLSFLTFQTTAINHLHLKTYNVLIFLAVVIKMKFLVESITFILSVLTNFYSLCYIKHSEHPFPMEAFVVFLLCVNTLQCMI